MWIIPSNHQLSSHFAPVAECSKMGLSELSEILPSRLMWRSKPFAFSTWLRRWNRVWWMRHLFGRIVKPSLHQDFTERYTASLVVIPASLSVLPVEEKGIPIRDTFGLIYENMLKQLDLFSATSKMCPITSQWDTRLFTKSYEIWVIRSRRHYAARQRLARHMKGNDYSFLHWITPTCTDGEKTPQVCQNKGGGALHHSQIGNIHSKTIRHGDALQWPAAPGRAQNLGEEKRTVKPGLGCTVDGYNFKDDLLRMLGNGVVEQAAELAFTELLAKHIKNTHANHPHPH
jgi:hypothetical protein